MTTKNILLARQSILKFYKTHEKIIIMMLKFILMLWSLLTINGAIGISEIINNMWVTLGLSVLSMIMPFSGILGISMIVMVLHLCQASFILGGIVALIYMMTYVMYIRLFPKESVVVLLVMLLLPLGGVYVVPLVSALFWGVSTLVALALGCLFHYMFSQFVIIMGGNITELSTEVVEFIVFTLAHNTIFNTEMLAVITILMTVFLLTYIIRMQAIDYSNYIAICTGGVISALGFLLAHLLLNMSLNVGLMIIMTILSTLIASFFAFMSIVLDYSRGELVQFEDEDNYYYVKVIPKIEVQAQFEETHKVFGKQSDNFTEGNPFL